MTDKSKKILLKNTIMLYILTFSNYFFNFITVPYQTRILGPEIYGKLGFALAFVTYFQLVLDFGFILSATEDISKNRDNKEEMSKILTCVNICKMMLGALLLIVLLGCCFMIPKFSEDIWLYVLYFVYVLINSFLPDFLYRGIEDMKIITYRSVAIKLFFTCAIFIFLKDKTQYYLVPIFNIIGSLVAVIAVYFHVIRKLKVKFVKVDFKQIKETFKRSSSFFLSRIATTVYSSTNIFILGFVYPEGGTLGLYTTSDKTINIAKSALTPISDSIYPYMIKNKDFKLIKKILIVCLPIMIIGCIIIGIFACPLCSLVFGEEYYDAGIILRYMLPLLIIVFPSYLFGFPSLSPLGLAKYANITTIIGAICQIIMLGVLYIAGILNVYTVCIATIITELVVLTSRVAIIMKNKRSNKEEVKIGV